MAAYDPQLIQRHADNLYRSATTTLVTFTVLLALAGGGVGLMSAEPA